jgi:hypothetical protein
LDERGGQGFGKTAEAKRPEHTWSGAGGDEQGSAGDVENGFVNGHRKGQNGMLKTITVEQEHVQRFVKLLFVVLSLWIEGLSKKIRRLSLNLVMCIPILTLLLYLD